MRRIPRRLAILLAIGLHGAGAWMVNSLFVSAQPQGRVVVREAPPPCEETIKGMGLEGQPVHCIEPPAPTHDPPQMHGDFHINGDNVLSFVGDVAHVAMFAQIPGLCQ